MEEVDKGLTLAFKKKGGRNWGEKGQVFEGELRKAH